MTAAIACATLLALSACGSGGTSDSAGDPTTDPTTPDAEPDDTEEPNKLASSLTGRTFLSSAVDGHTLVDGTQIQLSFRINSIGASSGCNGLSGNATYEGATLVVSDMLQTEMGCEAPLEEQDQWLSRLLRARPTLSLEGDVLTLTGDTMTGDDVTLTLLDREVAEPDVALVETTWVVDGVIEGDAVSSVPADATASITLSDGVAAIQAGCNAGSAQVKITTDTITFGPMALTRMMCPSGSPAIRPASS